MTRQRGLSPGLQLFLELVMHWLCTKLVWGRQLFPHKASAYIFVIAHNQA